MQNAEKADLHTETLALSSHFQKCGSGSLEEKREQELLVLPDQRDQAVWDAENDVKVPDGQQLLLPVAEPLLACIDLALRAVAIAA